MGKGEVLQAWYCKKFGDWHSNKNNITLNFSLAKINVLLSSCSRFDQTNFASKYLNYYKMNLTALIVNTVSTV